MKFMIVVFYKTIEPVLSSVLTLPIHNFIYILITTLLLIKVHNCCVCKIREPDLCLLIERCLCI